METEDQKPRISIVKFLLVSFGTTILLACLFVGFTKTHINQDMLNIIIEFSQNLLLGLFFVFISLTLGIFMIITNFNYYIISFLGLENFLLHVLGIVLCFWIGIKFRQHWFSYPIVVIGFVDWIGVSLMIVGRDV